MKKKPSQALAAICELFGIPMPEGPELDAAEKAIQDGLREVQIDASAFLGPWPKVKS